MTQVHRVRSSWKNANYVSCLFQGGKKKADTEESVKLTQYCMACFGLPRIYIGSESNKGAEEKSAEKYW